MSPSWYNDIDLWFNKYGFDEDVMIFKPTTFMNLSGTAVVQVVHYFKIDIDDIYMINLSEIFDIAPIKVTMFLFSSIVDKSIKH